MRNVVLTGFMGSGKSSAGKRAAWKLNMRFIDTDDWIMARAGMSIPEIFQRSGEAAFRELEREAARYAAGTRGHVIATGGGMVKDAESVRLLRESGLIIYIKCSAAKIYRNTKNDMSRPLLNTVDRLGTIERLLRERAPVYESAADYILESGGMSVERLAVEIDRIYREAER